MKTNNLSFTSVVTILLFVSLPALAGKPVNVPEVIVVSTVAGSGVLADPSIPNYRLQSDFLGDYYHGVDQVASHLQGGQLGNGAGDWEMYTTDSTVRRVTVDLREPFDANANPPFAYATVPARFIVKCHVVSPASIGGMRGLNSTLICPLIFSFFVGKDRYILDMNRGEFPDTNDVLVTCTAVTGDPADPNAPCTAWSIDPSVSDPTGSRDIARLLLPGKGGRIEDRGRFYVRFHVSFHK